jgi:N-methylhydantoinase A
VLADSLLAGGTLSVGRLVDARCIGQGAHMPVPLPPAPWPAQDEAVHALVRDAFRTAYVARYSRPPPPVPIELVHARVVLRGAPHGLRPSAALAGAAAHAGRHRRIVVDGKAVEAVVHRRGALPAGFTAAGPALVEEAGSTLVVGPGGRLGVLPSGNILVELE